ncbi:MULTISPECIES: hypothetical protein [unclassified Synechococcus]|uniref:hypothetical protein n=1 Tax=unclassified Synechococcus TaxID=2626047 RepID=UPI001C2203CF|nr:MULTISPECIES: hypothetical protein [unclassified Synechococcus]
MKIRFTIDYRGKARQASEKAAAAVFQTLNARFQAALAKPVYSWNPVTTIRSNGQEVGSPRNIIDTGLLRQSNTGPTINGLRAEFRWTAPYAAAVHEGARLSNGTLLPARPWTGAVLGTEPVSGIEPFDYKKAFKDTWLKAFNGG